MADGHDTASSVVMPDGNDWLVHVAPPLLVVMTDAKFPPSSPTATQVVVLAETLGAHETALTFTKGGEVNVVCH